MLILLPTLKTQITKPDFVKSFIHMWYQDYGVLPQKSNAAIPYAHWMLETAGSSFCWQWNLANVKAVDSPNQTVYYCMLANTWEMEHGKKVIYQPPSPVTWFRAFRSLYEGMDFYFNFLRTGRYKDAWGAVEKGDPALFSHLLRQEGYYTADEAVYTRIMNYHFALFMRDPLFDTCLLEVQKELFSVPLSPDFEETKAAAALNSSSLLSRLRSAVKNLL